jgi:hypothetical protein
LDGDSRWPNSLVRRFSWVILVVLFRVFLSRPLLDAAKQQSDKGLAGRMEGHAAMDMSVKANGSIWRRIWSEEGRTAVSHIS